MCTEVPCRCSCDVTVVTTDAAMWEEHPQLHGYPGRIRWEGCTENGAQYQQLWLILPDGVMSAITVHRIGTPRPATARPCWEWDGNMIKPTLTPSILSYTSRGGKRVEAWHGYLTRGRLVSV